MKRAIFFPAPSTRFASICSEVGGARDLDELCHGASPRLVGTDRRLPAVESSTPAAEGPSPGDRLDASPGKVLTVDDAPIGSHAHIRPIPRAGGRSARPHSNGGRTMIATTAGF